MIKPERTNEGWKILETRVRKAFPDKEFYNIYLCSYLVKKDTGLAPNPFHGYCTLSCCTPNHMNIQLRKGDWIAGFSTKEYGNKLIYAMRVSEVLDYNTYFYDIRFQAKKPKLDQDYKKRCGDNMYWLENGKWKGLPRYFHCDEDEQEKDCKYNIVYISDHFFYFGKNAVVVPLEFKGLIWDRHGVKKDFPRHLIESFIHWLETNHDQNVLYGEPRDRQKYS